MKRILNFLLMGQDGSTATLLVETNPKTMKKVAQECPGCTKIAFLTDEPIENGGVYKANSFGFFGPEFLSVKSWTNSFRFILNVHSGEAKFDHFYASKNQRLWVTS